MVRIDISVERNTSPSKRKQKKEEKEKQVFEVWRLKNFVKQEYPSDHPIQVIQFEKDIIDDPQEWCNKVEVWMKLARIKKGVS